MAVGEMAEETATVIEGAARAEEETATEDAMAAAEEETASRVREETEPPLSP